MSYVLFDIGGTKTRVAISDDLKEFSDPVKFETPSTCEEGVDAIIQEVKKLTDKEIRGIAGGIRGILDGEKTMMVEDPGGVLTGWEEKPLTKLLQKKLKATTKLANDAAVVALGEAVHGGGKGYDIVAYHTVSTGVGGARIDHGEIDSHIYGFEPGHQILDLDRTVLGEEKEPSLENLVSGSALEERAGMKPYEVPQDDAVWDQLAQYLAYGLRNTILYWSPDVIVLGGSMIVGDPRIFLADIIKHTHEIVDDKVPVPEIVDATLGDYGGLYGAMALLERNV